jgi:hypothetical protein
MCSAIASRLRTVPAGLHVAPAAGAIFADVKKEPPAGLRCAGMQALCVLPNLVPEQQIQSGLCQYQGGSSGLSGEPLPSPCEMPVCPSQFAVLRAGHKPAFQRHPIFRRGRPSLRPAIEDARKKLAQFDRGTQPLLQQRIRKFVQASRLSVRQDLRRPAEAEQVGVSGQQFPRAARRVAIVQRIHKIQRNVLGIQFEQRLFHRKWINLSKPVYGLCHHRS